MNPKTIQIFLPNGSPRSIRIAEITSRIVKLILVPRNKIDEADKREELKNVGVYFLFGSSEEKANITKGTGLHFFRRMRCDR